MSIFVPVLVIGALASAALAMENPESVATSAVGAPQIVPLTASDTVPPLGAYLMGAVADLNGKPEAALHGYLSALAEDPDNMELRQRSFELALMSGDVPNAVRLARSMPELEQTTMTRLAQMADAAHTGKVDVARKAAKNVTKASPELLQFRLLEAYLDYAHGTRVPELVAWIDALPMPESMAGRKFYHEARLWLKAGEPEKALDALKKAHRLEPGAVASTILLGETLARQGQPDAGAVVYDSFRVENPAVALLVPEGKTLLADQPAPFTSTPDEDLGATLSDFGLLIWAQGALGPARQVINLSLWLNPDDIYTRYYSGMLLEMGGDLSGAKVQYATLIDGAAPADVKLAAQIRLAEVQFKEGDSETPWKTLRQLAKDNPRVANLQRSVAQLAFNRGDFKQAVESYDALMAALPPLTPDAARAELLFARGAAHERAGQTKLAIDDLQAALKLAPTNPQVMNYLGYMWIDKGVNVDEAFELLQKAHLLAPEDGAITDSLGWAYYKQGDYATAMTYLSDATEQDPESPEIYDHLGDAYAKLGRKEDARREWQRALDLAAAGKEVPSDTFVKDVGRKLN